MHHLPFQHLSKFHHRSSCHFNPSVQFMSTSRLPLLPGSAGHSHQGHEHLQMQVNVSHHLHAIDTRKWTIQSILRQTSVLCSGSSQSSLQPRISSQDPQAFMDDILSGLSNFSMIHSGEGGECFACCARGVPANSSYLKMSHEGREPAESIYSCPNQTPLSKSNAADKSEFQKLAYGQTIQYLQSVSNKLTANSWAV